MRFEDKLRSFFLTEGVRATFFLRGGFRLELFRGGRVKMALLPQSKCQARPANGFLEAKV